MRKMAGAVIVVGVACMITVVPLASGQERPIDDSVGATSLEVNGRAVVDERDSRLWSFDGAAGDVVGVTAHGDYMAFDVVSPVGEFLALNAGRLVVRLPLEGRYLVRPRVVRALGRNARRWR